MRPPATRSESAPANFPRGDSGPVTLRDKQNTDPSNEPVFRELGGWGNGIFSVMVFWPVQAMRAVPSNVRSSNATTIQSDRCVRSQLWRVLDE